MALSLALRNCCRFQGLSSNIIKPENAKIFTRKYASLFNNGKLLMPAQNCAKQALVKRPMSSDHSKLWVVEKLVTLGLLGIAPATFIAPNIVLDDLFAILTVAHFHWGLEACVVDYIRPVLFGKAIPKISIGLLYLISAVTLGGLLFYNHHCIGIGCTVRTFWQIKE